MLAIRSRVGRALVWVAGLVLTGYVFHGLAWREMGQYSALRVVINLTGLLGCCGVVAWLAFVVPTDIAMFLFAVPTGIAVAGVGIAFALQRFGVVWIEANEYLLTAYGTTLAGYVHAVFRKRFRAGPWAAI